MLSAVDSAGGCLATSQTDCNATLQSMPQTLSPTSIDASHFASHSATFSHSDLFRSGTLTQTSAAIATHSGRGATPSLATQIRAVQADRGAAMRAAVYTRGLQPLIATCSASASTPAASVPAMAPVASVPAMSHAASVPAMAPAASVPAVSAPTSPMDTGGLVLPIFRGTEANPVYVTLPSFQDMPMQVLSYDSERGRYFLIQCGTPGWVHESVAMQILQLPQAMHGTMLRSYNALDRVARDEIKQG